MTLDENKLKLIKDSYIHKEPIFFTSSGLDITFQSHVIEFNDKYIIIKNTVKPQYIRNFVQSDKFNIRIQMVLFESSTIETDGVDIKFPLSNAIVIEDIRQSVRVSFRDRDNVYCQIKNPFDNETIITKSIMDLSESGMSLCTDFSSKLFESGVHFNNLTLFVHGHEYENQTGEVVYKRKFMDTNGKIRLQVGIKFHHHLKHNIAELKH